MSDATQNASRCFLGATSRGKAQCAGGVGFMTDYFCCL